jgi:serine/threonine protein kinase
MLGPHHGGTPGYFPPEGYSSAAGDVFSLGVALWAMLAGREPAARGPDVQLLLPPHLGGLLNALLEPDPRGRITIDGVLQRLGPVMDESPDWLKRLGFAAVVGGAVAVLAAAFSGKRE